MSSAALQSNDPLSIAKTGNMCQIMDYYQHSANVCDLNGFSASAGDEMQCWDSTFVGGNITPRSNMFFTPSHQAKGDVSFAPDFFVGTDQQQASFSSPIQSPQDPYQSQYDQRRLSVSSDCVQPAMLHSHSSTAWEYQPPQTPTQSSSVNDVQSPAQNTFSSPRTPSSAARKPRSRRSKFDPDFEKKSSSSATRPSSSPPPSSEPPSQREKNLQSNRKAAARCRQKKKQWIAQLEERCHHLKVRNSSLEDEADCLRREVYELKSLLLKHSSCGFGPIDTYISESAHSSFAKGRKT